MTLLDRFDNASARGRSAAVHPLLQKKICRDVCDAYFHGLWFATFGGSDASTEEGRNCVLGIAKLLNVRCDVHELDEDLDLGDEKKFALMQEVANVCRIADVGESFLDDFSKVWQSSGGDAVSLNKVGHCLAIWMQCEWNGVSFETEVPEAIYNTDEAAKKWKIEREDVPREILSHLKVDEPVTRRRFLIEGRMLIESNDEAIFANVDFIVRRTGYVEISSTVKSVEFRNCEFFREGTVQGRYGWLIESPSKAGISFENCRLNGNESLAAVKANGRLSFVCCKIANMYHWGDPIVSGEVVKFDRCVLRNLRGKQTSCVAMGNDLEIVRCVISQCQFEWKMFFVKGAEHSFVMRESKVKDSHAYSAIVWYKTDDGYALPFGFFDCCFVNVSYNQLSYATGLGVSTQIDMPEQEFDVKYELPNG